MPKPERGEVWLVDLGMVAKTRPGIVINIPFRDDERAVFAIIPHTTALRGGRFEVKINVPWLQPGLLMCKDCGMCREPFLCGILERWM
jgi:mRNA interferase MazF